MLFDSHNHLQSGMFGVLPDELVRGMEAEGITGCVVNATRQEDWGAVADLVERFPGYVFPAYGIHSWCADTAEEGWVESPPMEVQFGVFVKQAGIAAELGRVMTVHCFKAWEELFSAMEQAAAWPEKCLVHSFGGSIELPVRLLKGARGFPSLEISRTRGRPKCLRFIGNCRKTAYCLRPMPRT